MKMIRLEWRYLQKVALDHPYFDTHELPMTEKEAKAIVKENIKMTGKEFVDSIYASLGMTRPEEEKKRFAWLRSIGELFTVPPIRKIAIAVLVVVLMTVFFAATPTGRAIAESVIQYIATLFDDGRLIVNQSDNETQLFFVEDSDKSVISEQDERDDLMAYVFLESFDEFVESTGKTPVILSLPILELYYVHYPEIDYLELHSRYETANGEIIAFQIWDVDDSFSTTLIGISTLDADESIYYSIEEDGTIVVIKVLDESVLYLESKGTYSVDELAKLITSDKT